MDHGLSGVRKDRINFVTIGLFKAQYRDKFKVFVT